MPLAPMTQSVQTKDNSRWSGQRDDGALQCASSAHRSACRKYPTRRSETTSGSTRHKWVGFGNRYPLGLDAYWRPLLRALHVEDLVECMLDLNEILLILHHGIDILVGCGDLID